MTFGEAFIKFWIIMIILFLLINRVIEPYFRRRRERRSPEKIIEDQRKLDEFLGGSHGGWL